MEERFACMACIYCIRISGCKNVRRNNKIWAAISNDKYTVSSSSVVCG